MLNSIIKKVIQQTAIILSRRGGGIMRRALIIVGTIITLVVMLNLTNILNKPKVQENITITAHSSEKLGSVWYVNDLILDPSFKRGLANPKVGDNVEIGLNEEGIVVDWGVNN